MNKVVINLQKNCKATCAIVKECDYADLKPRVEMKANVSDAFLFGSKIPPFAEKVNEKCEKYEICYLLIKEIDTVSIPQQNRFLGLIKDREMKGYYLPDNCIIVFSVKDETTIKKISPDLYHFAVVAL